MTVIFLATAILILAGLGSAARAARHKRARDAEYLKACVTKEDPHLHLIRIEVEPGRGMEQAFWRHYGR